MTSDFSGVEAQMVAAREELDHVIGRAQVDLERFRRDAMPTREDIRALQEAALRGELGDDMRELARRIETGRDNWSSVFAGESPNLALLQGHLDRMAEENREAILTAIEDDPDFDPFPPVESL
jgi:hypothetical protein